MERKSFEKLIGTRRDTLLNALNGNLLSNKEDLIRDVLLSKGHKNNSEELNDEINKVESKITDIVSEHLEAEQVIDKLKIDGYEKMMIKKIVKHSNELPVRAESTATIPNNQPMKQSANHGS